MALFSGDAFGFCLNHFNRFINLQQQHIDYRWACINQTPYYVDTLC